jgi:CBS domain-containing protein
MKVDAIMTRDVVTAAPETSYKDVVERLVDRGVSALPVVDAHGSLVGIVTEADLVAKMAYPGRRHRALAVLADVVSGRERHWVTKARGWSAADVMTRDVDTCTPDEDARAVVRRMLAHGVKRVPVVEDGRLVGIVARQDVLRSLARPDAEIAEDVCRLLRTDPSRPDELSVSCSVQDGEVTLTGDVRYHWDEAIVVAMVRGVEGVADVESRIRHREPDPDCPTLVWPWVAPPRPGRRT